MYRQGLGVTQNDRQAVEWFRKAADQGMDEAQLYLGSMYALGIGVRKDEARAIELWKLAAQQGNALARIQLANRGIRY